MVLCLESFLRAWSFVSLCLQVTTLQNMHRHNPRLLPRYACAFADVLSTNAYHPDLTPNGRNSRFITLDDEVMDEARCVSCSPFPTWCQRACSRVARAVSFGCGCARCFGIQTAAFKWACSPLTTLCCRRPSPGRFTCSGRTARTTL